MSVVEKIRFDESFSFIYSPRPNTPAAEMEDNVSDSIKRKTARASVKTLLFFKWLQQENGRNFPKNSCYGCFKKRSRQLYGRTVCNKVVNFTSQSVDLIGQFINIQIVEALPNSLKGNLK